MNGPHVKDDLIGGRYSIIKYIAEGGMQYVYLADDKMLQRTVALKTPKNISAEKRFRNSAIVSARINHPNVAKTLDYLEESDRPYLVEEYIPGSDLDKALLKRTKHLDPYLTARVFHYLAKGLAASHHANVVHRDLKPTNIMVSGDFQISAIKITDFGIAKMADEEIAEAAEGGDSSISTSQTALGALPYMAPEAIETPRKVGKPADIWSIGAMMFRLMTGKAPYGTGLKVVQKILEATPPTFPAFMTSNPQFAELSNQLISIVLSCLTKDPDNRPTADELVLKCGDLCYPISSRHFGVVENIRFNAYGFITTDPSKVFFHLHSVYGDKPDVGDSVMFSQYEGEGAWRAHPVVKIVGEPET